MTHQKFIRITWNYLIKLYVVLSTLYVAVILILDIAFGVESNLSKPVLQLIESIKNYIQ